VIWPGQIHAQSAWSQARLRQRVICYVLSCSRRREGTVEACFQTFPWLRGFTPKKYRVYRVSPLLKLGRIQPQAGIYLQSFLQFFGHTQLHQAFPARVFSL